MVFHGLLAGVSSTSRWSLAVKLRRQCSSTSSSNWWSRAGAISRAQMEIQLSPHLTVLGLEAQIGLACSTLIWIVEILYYHIVIPS